jgi:SAM-dependent methyltransferase
MGSSDCRSEHSLAVECLTPGSQELQAIQYEFPYHYIPQMGRRVLLSRHWPFAASYIAALELVAGSLLPLVHSQGTSYRHVDIGCGDGALLYYLSRMPGFDESQLSGVDIDARAIAWARMFNPKVNFHVGDIAAMSETYSSASLVEVLEHIPPDTLPVFMQYAARLLRPEGLMVITVPCVEKRLAKKHFQHFSFDSIRALLELHFDNIKVFGFEKKEVLMKFFDMLRSNRFFCLEVSRLNKTIVNRKSRLHDVQTRCGRLYITCTRKSTLVRRDSEYSRKLEQASQ